MKTAVIIGPNGQLGTDLVKQFQEDAWNVIPLTHSDIQVEDINSVGSTLSDLKFDVIINTAAFHKVDECEKDTQKAWLINSTGQLNVSRIAADKKAKSVFISSDYVFSGETDSPYTPKSMVSPINAYGHSKAAGEIATLASNEKSLVFRISSVFGAAGSSGKGGNFVETILKKAQAGEHLNVVGDVHMSPTYTRDAARIISKACQLDIFGVIHANNAGFTSWHNFAAKILELVGMQADLTETSTDWSAVLKRPRFSALDTNQTQQLITAVPTWEVGLQNYLIEKGHI